ncbi:hypothetical protein VPIG_00171 [Vibrio phage PWH3a-P1]|uniref:hypothetical protein n=1 Tax=Vibrio phage PWH3a-P1 TaxID=754058 RepID=UPI0002C08F76|nr:hypothetical protein VPIG_00171 [Vibrio phage PWH3a-P1]AGH32028.1 hypothetical protein VPIG_00171 [Vibrio phage PWH3a-P1]
MSDITVNEQWQALSVLTGIAIGTQIKIQNKGTVNAILHEAVSQPLETDDSGELITSIVGSEPSKVIPAGSSEIWVKASTGVYKTILHVQEY